MRGFSLEESIFPFPNQILASNGYTGKVLAKDLISIESALHFLRDNSAFDVLVLQIGVADTIKQPPNFVKRIKKMKFRQRKTSNHLNVLGIGFNPKHLRLRKLIKFILFITGYYRPITDRAKFTEGVSEIYELSKLGGYSVIWLGSILGDQYLTQREIRTKRLYCGELFEQKTRDSRSSCTFVDVDHLLKTFVCERDVFHLNQAGHDYLAALVKYEICKLVE